MKCLSCFKNAKFVQIGTKLSFCNKKCQFDYISVGEKRKLEFDSNYVTIISNTGTEFKIERNLIGLADLEEYSTLTVPFESEDLYLLFYADYSLLYRKKEKLPKLNEIADFLDFQNGKLQDMEDLLNTGNLLEFVELGSIEFELYVQKAAFVVFTDFMDVTTRFDTENIIRFNVFNVSQYTLEIFESLTREDLFTLNLKPVTVCELLYIALELRLNLFFENLMKYIDEKFDGNNLIKSTNVFLFENPGKIDETFLNYQIPHYREEMFLRLYSMDGKIELLKQSKPLKVLIVYNNLLKYICKKKFKNFFIEQEFDSETIAIQLKYPRDFYEPVKVYEEGDEFINLEYDMDPLVRYQTKTILDLPDDIIMDILLYLKIDEYPNFEYFVMEFRSSHPRLWKVVSLFMKEHIS